MRITGPAPTTTTPTDRAAEPGPASEAAAFALLRAGVPLSLLLDLALPVHSRELLESERADTSWVPRRQTA